MRRGIRLVVVTVLLSIGFSTGGVDPARAVDPVNKSLFGVAIKGYDVVSYHVDGKPVEGERSYSFEWMDATWRFSSTEHRNLFAANPERYAPQYGGYCAYAVSQGTTAPIDPEAWRIVDDKLYLNLNKEVQAIWEQDIPGYIAKADGLWPTLMEED